MQVEHRNRELRCAQGLELFCQGEGSIFMTGLEAKTVAGYLVTFLDKIWVEGLDVSSRGEVERLFQFEVSRGEHFRSTPNEGRFEFVFDEAFARPTERDMVTGERWRQTLSRVDVKEAIALFEWIRSASRTVAWKCEAEWETVSIGFHSIRSLEEDLSVF